MDNGADEILQRVRRFAMPEGDVEPRDFRFAQTGEMRLAPDQPWLPFTAEQWMSGGSLDFRWTAWSRLARVAPVRVVDALERGSGRLTVSAFGVLPIVRERGAALDRGEVQRALAELPWRPFLFGCARQMSWEAPKGRTLRATYEDGQMRVSVDLEIDGEGRVVGGSAVRPRLVGGSVVETKWIGSFADYRAFGRFRVPTSAEVAWGLGDAPFVYWRGRLASFPPL